MPMSWSPAAQSRRSRRWASAVSPPRARCPPATTIPPTASRPWDKDRDGFVLGEGAGVLVLEEYEHAKRRGAKIYAELAGFGMGADAYHMTAPNVDGPKRSMRAALRNAGVNADQIQYLNAHGTSTPLGDVNETNAIKLAFGDHARKLVVNSTKSMTGHLLGGAGGIESVFTVLAVHHQVSPPTINIFNQDPECDLDYCANTAREMKIDVRGEEQLRLRRHQRHAGVQARLTVVRRLRRCSRRLRSPSMLQRCIAWRVAVVGLAVLALVALSAWAIAAQRRPARPGPERGARARRGGGDRDLDAFGRSGAAAVGRSGLDADTRWPATGGSWSRRAAGRDARSRNLAAAALGRRTARRAHRRHAWIPVSRARPGGPVARLRCAVYCARPRP